MPTFDTAHDAMPDETVFRITYWGITGAYTASIRPDSFSRQLREAIQSLAEQGKLSDIVACHEDDAAVERIIADHLPFHLSSTWGGNTTCIEVRTPDALIVIDSGSGFIELGRRLQQTWSQPGYAGSREANLLLTHSHMDHTMGMAFSPVSFDANNKLIVWSAQPVLDSVNAVMQKSSILTGVYFPQSYELLQALRELRPVDVPGRFQIGETTIETLALNHPGGCTGYRLNCRGRSVVFAFDHEQQVSPDKELAAWAADADLLCIDAQYRRAEYEGRIGIGDGVAMSRVGWGHSSVESVVETFVEAGARTLHLVHREPTRTDEDLSRLQTEARVLVAEKLRTAGRDANDCEAKLPSEGTTVEI